MRLVFFSPPARPRDEQARQAAVDASGILDRRGDPTLQLIVMRAAALMDTPMAALSVIDRHRQVFVGRLGIAQDETSRAASFCSHAILDPSRPMVVADALLDRRFAGNPLVQGGPRLRFYAGAPLVDAAGLPFGALCVIDDTARGTPPPDRLAALSRLAQEAMAEIAGDQRRRGDMRRIA